MNAKQKVTGEVAVQGSHPRETHHEHDVHESSFVADTKNHRIILVTRSQASELSEIFSDEFVQAAVDLGRMKIIDGRREARV